MKAYIIILWFVIIIRGTGQLFFDARVMNYWSSHPFSYKSDSADIITNPSIRLTREWEHVSLDYNGNFYQYNEVETRSYYDHDVSLNLNGNKIFLSLNYNQRYSMDGNYSYLNYKTLGVSLWISSLKDVPGLKFYTSALQNFYQELGEYDNLKINTGLSYRKKIFSRTTMFFNSSIDVKFYTGDPLTDAKLFQDSSSMMGKWAGNVPGPGSGRGGMVRPGFQGNTPIYQETDYSKVMKWNMSLRFAHSLHQRVGLAVMGNLGKVISGDSRLLSGPGTTTESSDIFDQSMGYNHLAAGIMLTYVAPRMIVTRVGYDWNHLEYINEGIFTNDSTYDSTTLRHDDRHYFWISASKSFYPDWALVQEIQLESAASLNMLISNSYWYDFQGHTVSVGLTFKM